MPSVQHFEVIAGQHHRAGKKYVKGDTVESTRDLTKVFPGKFKRVSGPIGPLKDSQGGSDADLKTAAEVRADRQAPAPSETPPPAEPEAPTGTTDPGEGSPSGGTPEGSPAVPLGTDVTSAFPTASEAGVLVFQKGQWFYVAEPEAPTVAVNEKGLKKPDLEPFLKGMLQGE